ncbi:MAG: FAD-dependent oxidoreductase, partial [Flavobacteriales bacterium]|nr:FAD-dependent oxidoreductase [Flavobacteriales bacterium]
MKKYDLCIIGGGPSGYAAAMRAVDLRKKVILIERDKIGGAGIFNGALTSKTMWELSTRYYSIKNEFPLGDQEKFDLSFDHLNKTVGEAVYDRKTQLQVHIKLLEEKYGEYFTYERGHGVLLNKNEVLITKKNKALE